MRTEHCGGQGLAVQPDDIEADIARLRAEGKLKDAASLAIDAYGNEVLSFLETMLRDHADSGDAFAQACEDLWKALPRFEGRSSMKTWFYTLARHAASRLRRTAYQKRLTSLSEVTDLAERIRSRTRPHLKTEVKTGFAAIRAALDDDDRTLLLLRVDRSMSWNDIARVMAVDDEDDSTQTIARVAARLRKRFQTVKETIRERARASGLIAAIDPDAEP
jgi:RNA polymerase sigma-70 factor (ECF subfamily)